MPSAAFPPSPVKGESMQIDSIELYLVENKFYTPWRTAYGCDAGNCVLITRMCSGSHEGWSESSALSGPNYSYEFGEGMFIVARRFLAPMLVGRSFATARELNQAMAHIKGAPFAKAGMEIAWWTLAAEIAGVPLGRLLGGSSTPVKIGDGWGICDTYDELIANIGRSFDAGYSRVKLKIAHGWDYDMLAAVRSVFPHETLHVDCNASYTFKDDLPPLRKLDRFHLAMIEQPFQTGDLHCHAKLQAMIDTPICLDETITEVWQAEQAAELKACQYVNIKPARVGGLQNTIDINRICMQAGIGCWIGGMLESDIGKAMCVEAATLPNMVYPHDITPAIVSYPECMTDVMLALGAGCTLTPSTRSGAPVRPDMEKMRKRIIASVRFSDDEMEWAI